MTGLNIGHQETGSEWAHIEKFHHPPQAVITKQQHTDPVPNPAQATREATAQQVGRQYVRLQF